MWTDKGAWVTLGLFACAAPAPAPAVAPSRPTASIPVQPAPTEVAWVGLADREYSRSLDGNLARPLGARLLALSRTEALLSVVSLQPNGYLAVVDLASRCVTETHPLANLGRILPEHVQPGPALAYLASDAGQGALARHMSMLARFEVHPMNHHLTRGYADDAGALSPDHQKMAVASEDALFYSANGGKTFARVAETIPGIHPLRVQFSPDGRYLYAVAVRRALPKPAIHGNAPLLVIVDVHGEEPAVASEIGLTGPPQAPGSLGRFHTPFGSTTPQGAPLFLSGEAACVLGANVATLRLDTLGCAPVRSREPGVDVRVSPGGTFAQAINAAGLVMRGWVFPVDGSAAPRALPSDESMQDTNIGPDDGGRVGWVRGVERYRIDTAEGTYDLDRKAIGTPLGFDLDGNVLGFPEPPTPRTYHPLMPLSAGTLGPAKCALFTRVDPKSGTKVR
jgi:hypothetical protein